MSYTKYHKAGQSMKVFEHSLGLSPTHWVDNAYVPKGVISGKAGKATFFHHRSFPDYAPVCLQLYSKKMDVNFYIMMTHLYLL